MWLGAHIGIAGGLAESVRSGRAIDCEAIQIFSKSPQMWAGPAIAPAAAEAFRDAVRSEGLRATAVHHGYLANLASPKALVLARSRRAFADEIARAELLGVDALILHPGAHLGSGVDAGLATLVASLRAALEAHPESKVKILLENMAGQGTTLGSTFDQLATVLSALSAPERVGVAVDSCHLFASGVDFRSEEGYGAAMDAIGRSVGIAAVRAFHLNDAKAPLGSHLDRHENIGRGEIGLEGFRHLVNDPRWRTTPAYLETPLDDDGYARYAADLATLRALVRPSPESGAAPAGRHRGRTRASTVK